MQREYTYRDGLSLLCDYLGVTVSARERKFFEENWHEVCKTYRRDILVETTKYIYVTIIPQKIFGERTRQAEYITELREKNVTDRLKKNDVLKKLRRMPLEDLLLELP